MKTTKQCKKCRAETPLNEFSFNAKTKDQLSSYCKNCVRSQAKEKYEKNKTVRQKQIAAWKEKHPEKTKKYSKNQAAKRKAAK